MLHSRVASKYSQVNLHKIIIMMDEANAKAGCNMSGKDSMFNTESDSRNSSSAGKSTYIRSIALMAVMAQIGCLYVIRLNLNPLLNTRSSVPAHYAMFPIFQQLFARVSSDSNHEANVSTFAAEMREASFILHNIDRRSLYRSMRHLTMLYQIDFIDTASW